MCGVSTTTNCPPTYHLFDLMFVHHHSFTPPTHILLGFEGIVSSLCQDLRVSRCDAKENDVVRGFQPFF
jgi:hypothetical protein